MHGPGLNGTNFIVKTGLRDTGTGRKAKNELDIYNYLLLSGLYGFAVSLHDDGFIMIWLILFILLTAYIVADHKNIIKEFKELWKRIK